MAEAEEADRASGVWEELSDKWEPGDMVQIEGLKSRADLNGREATVITAENKDGRIGVESMPMFMRFLSSDQTLNIQ